MRDIVAAFEEGVVAHTGEDVSSTQEAELLSSIPAWREPVAYALVGLIVVAATLESVFAYCIGCKVFGLLMRAGVIPPEVCVACNDLQARLQLRPR